METEKEIKLPPLDWHPKTTESPSTQRKPTLTGLGMNYLRFSTIKHKINSITNLIIRGFNACSTWIQFEMKFLAI